jgi:hypothetical protein
MPTGVKIDPKTWAKIRCQWQAGEYTFSELSGRYGISEAAIKRQSMRKQWKMDKPRIRKEIEKEIEGTTVEILARLGMPKERRIRLLIEGVEKADKLLFEGRGENMLATPAPDYRTRLAYLQEIHKMTGEYPPPKSDKDHIEKLEFQIIGNWQTEHKSAKELQENYQRFLKAAVA